VTARGILYATRRRYLSAEHVTREGESELMLELEWVHRTRDIGALADGFDTQADISGLQRSF
jgi:hypothetical protein